MGKLFEHIKNSINKNEWNAQVDNQSEKFRNILTMRFGSNTTSNSIETDLNRIALSDPESEATLVDTGVSINSSESSRSSSSSTATTIHPFFTEPRQSPDISNTTVTPYTEAQYSNMHKQRSVGGHHVPTIFSADHIPRVPRTNQIVSSQSNRRNPPRQSTQPPIVDDTMVLDQRMLHYYVSHGRGRKIFKANNRNILNGGCYVIGVFRSPDFLPVVAKQQRTCSAHQLRQVGGVIKLPGNRGYLIESVLYDVGYGIGAKRKDPTCYNFARAIRLVHPDDPRVNVELAYTPFGNLIIRPTKVIRGHVSRPIELLLAHSGTSMPTTPIPALVPIQTEPVRPTNMPFFRASGRRRDPVNIRPTITVLPQEEQPRMCPQENDSEDDQDRDIEHTTFGKATGDAIVSSFNMMGNGTSEPFLTAIVRYARKWKVDMLALTDLGITRADTARSILKRLFGTALIYIIPAKAPRRDTGRRSRSTGGMAIIILNNRVKVSRHFKDPSGLGIHHTVRCKIRSKQVDVMFVYWPTDIAIADNDIGHSDSLLTKLKDYLLQNDIDTSPNDWIMSQIRTRAPELDTYNSRYFILMGDMNREYNLTETEISTTLAGFVTDLGLTTSLKTTLDVRGCGSNSFYRGDQETEIDHICTNIPEELVTTGGRGTVDEWCKSGYTDHPPIHLGFSFEHLDSNAVNTPEVELILGAVARIENDSDYTRNIIKQTLQEWWDNYPAKKNNELAISLTQPVEMLGKISEDISRDMAQKVINTFNITERPHRNSGIRFSHLWSSKAASIVQHATCMSRIKRLLKKPLEFGHQCRLCIRALERWRRKLHARRTSTTAPYDYKPEDERCTGIQEWLTLFENAANVSSDQERNRERKNLCDLAGLDYDTTKRLLNSRHRKRYIEDIGQPIQSRENRLIDKKLKRAIASLTESGKSAYSFSELTLSDGSVITDQEDIHQKVTKFFEDIFKNPVDAIPTKLNLEEADGSSIPKWQRMLEDGR